MKKPIYRYKKASPRAAADGKDVPDISTLSADDKAVLSHWAHQKDTSFAQPYQEQAETIVSDWWAKNGRVEENAAFQYMLPSLFEVPFPPPKKTRFTFIDLFAGIGGFRMALQRLGGKCVFSSEWNELTQQTYFDNYGEMPFGDITRPETKSFIPDGFDMLCAGFPCQPFSISGKMKGFNDVRGTLFFDVCEIIQAKKPKVVFLENVKHLIHHANGSTLKTILAHLREMGYSADWRLMNAADFGVAQNRERVIIMATKGEAFNFDTITKKPRVLLEEVLDEDGDFEFLKPEAYTLIDAPREQESGLIFVGYRNKKIRKAGVRAGTEHLSRVHKQPNRIYSVKGIHPTLPSQEASGRFFIHTHAQVVRKLTIAECYKLMGFPEKFKMSFSASAQYTQIGNSVCVPMIEAAGKATINQGFLSKESK
jgi:DNA (cytosine-5)-methyltransferase 1